MTTNTTMRDRLDFIGFDAAARRDIGDIKSVVMRELPGALDGFYAKIRTPRVWGLNRRIDRSIWRANILLKSNRYF